MTFNTEFKQHISTNNLIGNGTHVLVAVSGGVDSMVLLHLLSGLRREKKLQLSAIHVQHHLRTDAEEDAHLVKSFCDENDPGKLRQNPRPAPFLGIFFIKNVNNIIDIASDCLPKL